MPGSLRRAKRAKTLRVSAGPPRLEHENAPRRSKFNTKIQKIVKSWNSWNHEIHEIMSCSILATFVFWIQCEKSCRIVYSMPKSMKFTNFIKYWDFMVLTENGFWRRTLHQVDWFYPKLHHIKARCLMHLQKILVAITPASWSRKSHPKEGQPYKSIRPGRPTIPLRIRITLTA